MSFHEYSREGAFWGNTRPLGRGEWLVSDAGTPSFSIPDDTSLYGGASKRGLKLKAYRSIQGCGHGIDAFRDGLFRFFLFWRFSEVPNRRRQRTGGNPGKGHALESHNIANRILKLLRMCDICGAETQLCVLPEAYQAPRGKLAHDGRRGKGGRAWQQGGYQGSCRSD